MMPSNGPPTPTGVGGPTSPLVSRGSEEEWKTKIPTWGTPTPNGRGGPTPPPRGGERSLPLPKGGERKVGRRGRILPQGEVRSLPLLKGRKSSLPLLRGGERSLPPPKRGERRKGDRRGGARRADQKNRHVVLFQVFS